MGIISIILSLLSSLPQIIAIIKEIISLIANIKDPKGKKDALSGLLDAYSSYKEDGDASKLKQLHDDLSAIAKSPSLARE